MKSTTQYDSVSDPGRENPEPGSLRAPAPSVAGLCRKLKAIRALALFADIPEIDLVPLATAALLRRFARGRRIGRVGTRHECVILVSGRAKTSTARGESNASLTLATFGDGDILSETCWATGQPTLEADAIALDTCEVLFLPRRVLEELLDIHGQVAVRLLVATVNKLSKLTRLTTRRTGLDVGDRLYCKLIELTDSAGRRSDDGIVIEHGLQQNELAASIAASREAVNRQLGLWRDQGLIESRRGVVVIRDPAGLRMSVSPAARIVELELGAMTTGSQS